MRDGVLVGIKICDLILIGKDGAKLKVVEIRLHSRGYKDTMEHVPRNVECHGYNGTWRVKPSPRGFREIKASQGPARPA